MSLTAKLRDKKHIVWDWNGTILDDVQHAVNITNALLSKQRLPTIDIEQYRTIFEFPIKNYYDKLGFDYSLRSFENLCHDFVDLFMSGIDKCKPHRQIEGVINLATSEGKTQSVLSMTDQDNLDLMIDRYGFSEHFDFVFGTDNKLAASKLERGKELILRSTICKDDTILVGDTLHDLEVGEELGIDVILISHGHQSSTLLQSHHHNVVAVI